MNLIAEHLDSLTLLTGKSTISPGDRIVVQLAFTNRGSADLTAALAAVDQRRWSVTDARVSVDGVEIDAPRSDRDSVNGVSLPAVSAGSRLELVLECTAKWSLTEVQNLERVPFQVGICSVGTTLGTNVLWFTAVCEPELSASSVVCELYDDYDIVAVVTVVNTGTATAHDVVCSIIEDGQCHDVRVGDLDPDQRSVVRRRVASVESSVDARGNFVLPSVRLSCREIACVRLEAQPLAYGESVLSAALSAPSDAFPGSVLSYSLLIRNDGSAPTSEVAIRIRSSEGLRVLGDSVVIADGGPLGQIKGRRGAQGPWFAFRALEAGDSATVTFSAVVGSRVSDAVSIEVDVKERSSEVHQQASHQIIAQPRFAARSRLALSSSSVRAGESISGHCIVANEGTSDASDVVLTLAASHFDGVDNFEPLGGDVWARSLGNIAPGQSIAVPFRARVAAIVPNGDVGHVDMAVCDGGRDQRASFRREFTIVSQPVFDTESCHVTAPSTIRAGEEQDVTIALENCGSDVAQNVAVSLRAPEQLRISESRLSVGDLAAGDHVELRTRIALVAPIEDDELLPLVATIDADNTSPIELRPALIWSRSEARLEGTLSVSVREAMVGDIVDCVLVLRNVGDGAARKVEVVVDEAIGMAYVAGTALVDEMRISDAADGSTLSGGVLVGSLRPSDELTLKWKARILANAAGAHVTMTSRASWDNGKKLLISAEPFVVQAAAAIASDARTIVRRPQRTSTQPVVLATAAGAVAEPSPQAAPPPLGNVPVVTMPEPVSERPESGKAGASGGPEGGLQDETEAEVDHGAQHQPVRADDTPAVDHFEIPTSVSPEREAEPVAGQLQEPVSPEALRQREPEVPAPAQLPAPAAAPAIPAGHNENPAAQAVLERTLEAEYVTKAVRLLKGCGGRGLLSHLVAVSRLIANRFVTTDDASADAYAAMVQAVRAAADQLFIRSNVAEYTPQANDLETREMRAAVERFIAIVREREAFSENEDRRLYATIPLTGLDELQVLLESAPIGSIVVYRLLAECIPNQGDVTLAEPFAKYRELLIGTLATSGDAPLDQYVLEVDATSLDLLLQDVVDALQELQKQVA